jgi:hypothetical protein
MSVYTFDWKTTTDDRHGYVIVRSDAAHRAAICARREVRARRLEPRFDLNAIMLDVRLVEPEAEQSREPEDAELEYGVGWVGGTEAED